MTKMNKMETWKGPVIDESVLSTKELLGLQQAEERLKRRLHRQAEKRVTALFVS